VDASAVIDNPPILVAPAALVVATTLLVTVLMRSDVATRAEAVIDPLTGMLNRKALAVRAAEVREQSRGFGQPVGVVVGDIDRFKAINDTHGHVTGDAVLKGVAYALRKELRAFDAIYRIGGEEFLVLVPGAGVEAAAEVAERLRGAVRVAELVEGLHVTMSFGVSASLPGEVFDYDREFARADERLYAAKAAGRDCVRAFTPACVPALAV
jgi:diguanylate cyclase (GGDEF)-like protein